MPDRPRPLLVLLGLFLLSGAIGLVYEVLWVAYLARVFGATAEAAAATLTTFFLGLAAGAWAGARWSRRLRRPLRAYGLLEVGIALAAGAGLLLVPAQGWLYGLFVERVGTTAALLTPARLLLTALLLGPAAFLMGATLPVLGEYVVRRRDELGRRGSLLYAANTLGAAAGCALGGFVLPPALGYRATYLWAVAASVVVGILAVGLAAGRGARPPRLPAPPRAARPPLGWRSLALASGLLALALQVLWTRMFAQTLPNSVHSFATVLCVFLVALAVGGGLAHLLARRPWPVRGVLGALLAGAALLVAASLLLFAWRTGALAGTGPRATRGASVLSTSLDALLVLGPPVVVLGAVFPYLMRAVQGRVASVGGALGALAAWNTVGAALGALAGGFVLLPALGMTASIRGAALVYAALALVVSWRAARAVRALAWVAVVAVGASLVHAPPLVRARAGEQLLEAWEGATGTVTVIEEDDVRKLRFNNVLTLGGTEDSRWERIQTHVALALHPSPRRVFYLGMGTGITAGAALDHPVERVVVVELVPEVITAARRYFRGEAGALFDDAERVAIVPDDGRHLLRWSAERYDVIVGDLFFPWEAGAADLYTVEHFRAVRERLRPGGHFAQWLACYQLSRDELISVARSLVEAFPLVTVWRGDFASRRPILALVGHAEATPLDPRVLVDRARSLPDDETGWAAYPTTLPFFFYAGNLSAARHLLADARLHTDDRPWIAWDAAKEQRRREAGEATAFVGTELLAFERSLRDAVPPDEDPYLQRLTPSERRRVRGGFALRSLSVHTDARAWPAHREALRDYVRYVPAAERPPLEAWVE